MGFGNFRSFLPCLIIVLSSLSYTEALRPGGYNVVTVYYSESVRYQSCNGWWRGCSTRYRQVWRERYQCKLGWTNKGEDTCPYPLCGYYYPRTDPGACNIGTGCRVITRSGTICQSGGTCSSPNRCVNCNHGHYSTQESWGYCALCQQIAHCNYADCTLYGNSRCKYCEGEYTEQYGYYAYTRFRDNGLSCQIACSWRYGSRCFPGNCKETTLTSCRCATGYGGTDCATIDVYPDILNVEMTFELIGDNTTEKEIIEGEDGHISWTSLNVFTDVKAKVKAAFKQNFMYPPPSYINKDKTQAGIIRMSLSLYLFRNKTQVETYLYSSCTPDGAESYTCYLQEPLDEKSSKWKNYLSFEHKDRIEWELYDFHSGIHEVSWRLFDNHTSLEHELLHGTSYLSPQGDAYTMSDCTQKYGPYPKGANCYCTPFHGCYHKHFQVKPEIILSGEGGLFQNGSKGLHDIDYYFQVLALNGALHRTAETIKVSLYQMAKLLHHSRQISYL